MRPKVVRIKVLLTGEAAGVRGSVMGPPVHGSGGGGGDATFPHEFARTFKLNERAKRVLDIVLATMGLLLFAPILLISSVAIKLDSHGPVFIRAPLDGDMNRSIKILKFRVVTACAKSEQINGRLTWVGRMLVQSGIDELPQLFNILSGEMTIVGRPNVHRWSASIN